MEAAVRLHIQAELEPQRRRGQLSREQCAEVTARCTAKVLAKHAGASSADFLAAEGPAIARLVAKYVEHVRQRHE